MASEETEVAAQNAAPTKPRATGSSASRWGILAGLRERLKRIRLIDLLPGLALGAAVMALYTYYSLQQVKHWVTPRGTLQSSRRWPRRTRTSPRRSCRLRGRVLTSGAITSTPSWCYWGRFTGCFLLPTTLLVVQNALIAAATSAIVFFDSACLCPGPCLPNR